MKPRRKPAFPIQVAAEDASRQEEDLLEKLKEEARNGLPGLGVSLGIHALVLLIMMVLVVHRSETDPLTLLGSWTKLDSRKGAPDGEEGKTEELVPVVIQTNIGTVKVVTPSETPDPEEKNPGVKGVRAANVDGLLKNRSRRVRDDLGVNQDAETAVTQGLGWLARIQQPAGNWKLEEDQGFPDGAPRHLRTDTGATALALLCFLGDGHTHLTGDFTTQVRKGLDWLKSIQQDSGLFSEFTELGRQTTFYAHAQATIAMCEAYAMTGDDTLREAAERGVQYLVITQQPIRGGWKYQPQDEESRGDLSVSGWALMALHTARAAGMEVPDEALVLGSRFLDTVQEHDGALYKYEEQKSPEECTPALTAQGLLCRQYFGWPKDHPPLIEGLAWLEQPQFRPTWEANKRNLYHWYYATQVFHNMGGDRWQIWYKNVMDEIIPNQVNAGAANRRGSWNPFVKIDRSSGAKVYGDHDEYAQTGGRLYITCLCILTLEAPYRHVPLYSED